MIKQELWILFALKDASQGYGFDIRKWFLSEKPDEFDINNTDFQDIIDNLETEGIIKRALNEQVNFYLTDKGKKELAALKKQLKFKEYYRIISNFPEIEVKERVKSLESFVISSIIISFGSVFLLRLSQIVSSYGSNIIYLILFLYIFILIASYYVGSSLGAIMFFWINDVQRETLWKYKEWFWHNQGIINKVFSGLIIIFVIILFNYLQVSSWKDSIVIIALGIIVILIERTYFKKS